MTYAALSATLKQVLAAVPGVTSVSIGAQYRPTRRGGIIPQPGDCPAIRITAGPVRLLPFTHDGDQQRYTSYLCSLWAYEDDATLGTAAWETLRENVLAALKRARPVFRALPGVLDARVVSEQPPRRPLTAPGNRGLLETEISVQTREQV